MKRILLPIALFSTLALGVAGCGEGGANPTAPSAEITQSSAVAATADVRAEIVLSGLVRNLNWRAHTFTLVGRTAATGAPKLIHLNDRTAIMVGDRRVRARTLENGAAVEVHGVERDGDVLAVKIVITRRGGR